MRAYGPARRTEDGKKAVIVCLQPQLIQHPPRHGMLLSLQQLLPLLLLPSLLRRIPACKAQAACAELRMSGALGSPISDVVMCLSRSAGQPRCKLTSAFLNTAAEPLLPIPPLHSAYQGIAEHWQQNINHISNKPSSKMSRGGRRALQHVMTLNPIPIRATGCVRLVG